MLSFLQVREGKPAGA